MLHIKHMSELISNYIAIHQKHFDIISKAKENHRENMVNLYHQHLDNSIEQLQSFHSKLEEDGNTKSKISSALIKAAIDNRRHLKSKITHRKNGVNIHIKNIKRLAMGVFAVLGLSTLSMNSTDAAAFQASTQPSHSPAATAYNAVTTASNAITTQTVFSGQSKIELGDGAISISSISLNANTDIESLLRNLPVRSQLGASTSYAPGRYAITDTTIKNVNIIFSKINQSPNGISSLTPIEIRDFLIAAAAAFRAEDTKQSENVNVEYRDGTFIGHSGAKIAASIIKADFGILLTHLRMIQKLPTAANTTTGTAPHSLYTPLSYTQPAPAASYMHLAQPATPYVSSYVAPPADANTTAGTAPHPFYTPSSYTQPVPAASYMPPSAPPVAPYVSSYVVPLVAAPAPTNTQSAAPYSAPPLQYAAVNQPLPPKPMFYPGTYIPIDEANLPVVASTSPTPPSGYPPAYTPTTTTNALPHPVAGPASQQSQVSQFLSGQVALSLGDETSGTAPTIHLNTPNLDNFLANMPIDSSGKNGRFTIGNLSMQPALIVIQSLSKYGKKPHEFTSAELQSFLIVVAATLKLQQEGSFTENTNVDFFTENNISTFTSYTKNNSKGAIFSTEDVLNAWKIFKQYMPAIPDALPTSNDEMKQLNDKINKRLTEANMREYYITVYPKSDVKKSRTNPKIAYVLLKFNEETGQYEFPKCHENDIKIQTKKIMRELKPDVSIPEDLENVYEGFKNRGAFSVVNPAVDDVVREHVIQSQASGQNPKYMFVRVCNLGMVKIAAIHPDLKKRNEAQFGGITADGKNAFISLLNQRYNIAPSVLNGQDVFFAITGFLSRVIEDFSVQQIASKWNPELRDPIQPASAVGSAPTASTSPPLNSHNQLQTGNFTPVGLSQAQTEAIIQIQATIPEGLNPKRGGTDFMPVEREIGATLTQVSTNGINGMRRALCMVFSNDRSESILKQLIKNTE